MVERIVIDIATPEVALLCSDLLLWEEASMEEIRSCYLPRQNSNGREYVLCVK